MQLGTKTSASQLLLAVLGVPDVERLKAVVVGVELPSALAIAVGDVLLYQEGRPVAGDTVLNLADGRWVVAVAKASDQFGPHAMVLRGLVRGFTPARGGSSVLAARRPPAA